MRRSNPRQGTIFVCCKRRSSRFLPAYENLRFARVETTLSGEPATLKLPRLHIDHCGTALDVDRLSDGERGVLALVLDLAPPSFASESGTHGSSAGR